VLSVIRHVLAHWELRSREQGDAASGGGAGLTEPPNSAEQEAERLWREATTATPFRRDALLTQVAQNLVRGLGPALVHYCAQQLQGDRVRAEDAAQKAFVTFWRSLPSFEGRSTLRTWLYGIAYNHCRQDRRDETRDRTLETTHEDRIRGELHALPPEDTEAALDRDARRREVLAVIERLEPRHAWLLKMRLIEQRDYQALLPQFQATFGDSITTPDGLRTAFYHAKTRLFALLEAP